MSAHEKPPPQRWRYRRREITIEEPIIRAMNEQERRAASRALGRLFAAMLADEDFVRAEQDRQRYATRDHRE